MSSKVVHMRTDVRNIAACYRLLERAGMNANVPISTAVDLVLSGYLREEVANMSEDDIITTLDKYTGKPEFRPPEVKPPTFDTPEEQAEMERAFGVVDQNEVAKAVERAKAGGMNAEAPDDLPDVEESPPWDGVPYANWDDIVKAFPKDMLVEQAKDDPYMQRAIGIVYYVQPNKWGTDESNELIATLTDKFTNWAKAHYGGNNDSEAS